MALARELATDGCTVADVEAIADHVEQGNPGKPGLAAAMTAGILGEPGKWADVAEDIARFTANYTERSAAREAARPRKPEPGAGDRADNEALRRAGLGGRDDYVAMVAFCMLTRDHALPLVVASAIGVEVGALRDLAIRGGELCNVDEKVAEEWVAVAMGDRQPRRFKAGRHARTAIRGMEDE